MSKVMIWMVTMMMGLAMAAFIVLQFYWIKTATGIQTEQFDQLVSRSLIDIAHQIEYREAVRMVSRQTRTSADSGGFSRLNFNNMVQAENNNAWQDDSDSLPLNTHALEDGASEGEILPQLPDSEAGGSGFVGEIPEPGDSLSARELLINNILANMYNMPADIEDRLDESELLETSFIY